MWITFDDFQQLEQYSHMIRQINYFDFIDTIFKNLRNSHYQIHSVWKINIFVNISNFLTLIIKSKNVENNPNVNLIREKTCGYLCFWFI